MAYQKDISAVLGLSISAVSKALNGYPDISEETRKKVLKTAEELDYNCISCDRRRSGGKLWGTVGILAPGSEKLVKSPYYKELICGMTGEAARNQRDLVIMGDELAEQEMSWIGRVIARKVDGICLLARKEDLYKGRFVDLLESGIPLVSVDNEVTGYTSICRDFRKNARMILKYLRENGHRTAAFSGKQSLEYRKCASILEQEAESLDLECLEADFGESTAQMIISLREEKGVSCIIFTSHEEAACRIRQWEKSGLHIPEDISVVVLQTNREEWYWEKDGITCVSNAPAELGKEAIRRLVRILEHPETDLGETMLFEGILTRGTTLKKLGGNSARKY